VYGNSPDASSTSVPSSSAEPGARTQRYNYLIGRLRGRQITMEEATELFALMQGMLARANEVARVAALRVATPPSAGVAPAVPPPPRVAGPSTGADDLLLVGILAMGAGAGLLAALSKRMGDGSPPSPSGSGRSSPSTPPR
jgi:hypothetical protein